MTKPITWNDEIKAEVESIYLAKMEEFAEARPDAEAGEYTMEAVEAAAEAVGTTVASARMQLNKLGVYVKVKAKTASKAASGEPKAKRISKADAQAELISALTDGGATEVDEDIISKMTGKAMAHIAEKVREILAAQ